MSRYVSRQVKRMIEDVDNKQAVQADTNFKFNITDTIKGIDYGDCKQYFGQVLFDCIPQSKRNQNTYYDRHGRQTLFFKVTDLDKTGKRIYKTLIDKGISRITINRWLDRAAQEQDLKITRVRGGVRNWLANIEGV
mgnify:CR=1 FL=1